MQLIYLFTTFLVHVKLFASHFSSHLLWNEILTKFLPSLLRMQISNDEICLGANINKFDQMWYLLRICIDFAVVVNPFFRAVLAG